MESFVWKIGGEAGFGVMTTGVDFAKIASKMGYYSASYADYPSLIRGGHNTFEVHVSNEQVRASRSEIRFLICLNKETFEAHKDRLTDLSVVLYDKEMFDIENPTERMLHLPMKNILKTENASIVMMNTVALAASLALVDWPIDVFLENLSKTFKKKGDEVIAKNHTLAKAGYDYILENYSKYILKDFQAKKSTDDQLIMTGNDAFSLGAVIADCRLYCAYPMTPSSSVLTRIASWEQNTGMVVRHAEDEISVVNEAIGGAFGGVRAACGTSGGGFALMTESISFAGVAEIPIVIFLAQRAGPATGMPTWTEQADLLFAVHAGHGDFPKIVLTPGDVEEMYQLSAEAFNLADRYQTPVLVLSDKHLSESHWSTPRSALKLFGDTFEIDRGKILSESSEVPYLRYKVTEDGVSPMLIPGQDGVYYQANSYEHIEDSHTTESAEERIKQVEKRSRKIETYLSKDFKAPHVYGDISTSQIMFVGWGSTKMVMMDVLAELKKKGISASYMHFTHVSPMDVALVRDRMSGLGNDGKRWIMIENNSTGQFNRSLREQTGLYVDEMYLKYDGRQIYVEDVINYVLKS